MIDLFVIIAILNSNTLSHFRKMLTQRDSIQNCKILIYIYHAKRVLLHQYLINSSSIISLIWTKTNKKGYRNKSIAFPVF
jgi:hypothetical protein